MNRRSLGLAAAAFALVALAGCAAAASPSPSPSPSPTPQPAVTTEAAYRTAACAARASRFRAVGNPDTGSGADPSRALDEAVQARARESADRLAAEITAELRAGRGHLATAAGWQPRAVVMREANRVFAAFEAMVAAKR